MYLAVQNSHTSQRVHIQLNYSQDVSLVARNKTDNVNDTAKCLEMHVIQFWFMTQDSLTHENRR
jgi:hypothetical protein